MTSINPDSVNDKWFLANALFGQGNQIVDPDKLKRGEKITLTWVRFLNTIGAINSSRVQASYKNLSSENLVATRLRLLENTQNKVSAENLNETQQKITQIFQKIYQKIQPNDTLPRIFTDKEVALLDNKTSTALRELGIEVFNYREVKAQEILVHTNNGKFASVGTQFFGINQTGNLAFYRIIGVAINDHNSKDYQRTYKEYSIEYPEDSFVSGNKIIKIIDEDESANERFELEVDLSNKNSLEKTSEQASAAQNRIGFDYNKLIKIEE